MPETRFFRRWMALALVLVMALSLSCWFASRESLPPSIRIAAGAPGGQYHQLAQLLAARLREQTGVVVEVAPTQGSRENARALEEGTVDLALVQSGDLPDHVIHLLAPLYPEPVLVITRDGSDLAALTGRLIAGPGGSGMAGTAATILKHFHLPAPIGEPSSWSFTALADREEAAGALVTSGVLNPDLRRLVRMGTATGPLQVRGVADARALARLHPQFHLYRMPAGLLCSRPRIPAQDLTTVATTATLCAGRTVNRPLVEAALQALYRSDLRQRIPTLLSPERAARSEGTTLHPAAREWFDPYAGLGVMADFLESISAAKELLFALGAALFLLLRWWGNKKRKERQEELQRLKDRLDQFLQRTVEVERAQMEEADPRRLEELLDRVTAIKLEALEELTHEELRGDNHFAIFLTQCANLIRKIQSKILYNR